MKRPRRAFTLLEMILVLALLGIVLAIALPYMHHMRDNNAINAAAQQLKGEFEFAQGQAKSYGVAIDDTLKAGPFPDQAKDIKPGPGLIVGRVRQRPGRQGQDVTTVKFFKIGSRQTMQMAFSNFPLIDMDSEPRLTGTVLEIGTTSGDNISDATFTPMATIAFDANGEPLLVDPSKPGIIELGRFPDHVWTIETNQLGRLTLRKGQVKP